MSAISCQNQKQFSYFLFNAVSVLKIFSIIYMLFTLLTVISLSAEPPILLIIVILTLTICLINE